MYSSVIVMPPSDSECTQGVNVVPLRDSNCTQVSL